MAALAILAIMLLNKQVAARKVSKGLKLSIVEPYDLEGIEQSLLGLAKAGSTPGLTSFLGDIKQLTAQMQDQLLVSLNNTQTRTLDPAWEAYKNCSLDPKGDTDLPTLNATHAACRRTQKAHLDDWQSCVVVSEDLNATRDVRKQVLDLYSTAPIACEFPAQGDTSQGTLAFMMEQLAIFENRSAQFTPAYDDWVSANQTANAKGTECWTLRVQYLEQQASCDEHQHQMEEFACGGGNEHCDCYIDCYTEKRSAWLQANATATNEHDSLVTQWRAILRIECLLDAFNRSDQGQESMADGISRCKSAIWRSEAENALTMTWWPTAEDPDPGFIACNDTSGIAHQPGSKEWIATFYAQLPEDAAAEACHATCCLGPIGPCCQALTATCMSCQQGLTAEEFCAKPAHAHVDGCGSP